MSISISLLYWVIISLLKSTLMPGVCICVYKNCRSLIMYKRPRGPTIPCAEFHLTLFFEVHLSYCAVSRVPENDDSPVQCFQFLGKNQSFGQSSPGYMSSHLRVYLLLIVLFFFCC